MPLPGEQHRESSATTNPFCPPQHRVSDYTAQEIATISARLSKQLGPEYISTRQGPGGGRVHYLAAEKVINLANEVFGFNGWSSAIQNVQVDFVDEDPRSGDVTLGLSAIVRVTLRDGTYHEDIGYGQMKNCKGKAAAFEKAKKEAVTDALKRALRNFGNVLGNCLYDKDYLQKVTKIKVTPAKWDAENLHRHPDFLSTKKDVPKETEIRKEIEPASCRQISAQSAASFGSIEFDDFEAHDFDDVDLAQNDGDDLGQIQTKHGTDAARKQQSHGLQGHSAVPPRPPSNLQPQMSVSLNQRGLHPPIPHSRASDGGQPQPSRPQPNSSLSRQHEPSTVGVHPMPTITDSNALKSNSSSAVSIESPSPNFQAPQKDGTVSGKLTGAAHEESEFSAPRMPPPGNPEGFVTGRVADILNQNPGPRSLSTAIPQFDPRADSPSIRRTQGFNHGKSAPVTRQSLGTVSIPAGSTAASVGPGNGMNGTTTPVRTNYVNPTADPNRRIGMPQHSVVPPMQNRNAYRPPTAVKRPPLSDVSNLQMDGSVEPKKVKTDTNEEAATSASIS